MTFRRFDHHLNSPAVSSTLHKKERCSMSLLVYSGVEFFLELFCDVWNEGNIEHSNNNYLGRIVRQVHRKIPAMHLASA